MSMELADTAGGYVRRMVERESRGWGDQTNAQQRLERRYGLPFWALEHLRTGRAKTVEAGLFARIRGAYLDLCERQVAKLQNEIAVEKALNEDVSLEDLGARGSQSCCAHCGEKSGEGSEMSGLEAVALAALWLLGGLVVYITVDSDKVTKSLKPATKTFVIAVFVAVWPFCVLIGLAIGIKRVLSRPTTQGE
jgi:hypothetical protein